MTAPNVDPTNPQPFGAQVRRSNGPLYFFAALFLAWFAFIVWLAAFSEHR